MKTRLRAGFAGRLVLALGSIAVAALPGPPRVARGVEIPADFAAPPELGGALRFEVDPAASEITIGIVSTLHDIEGKTSTLRGTVTGSIARLAEDAEVHLTIDAASITTGLGLRDRGMRENQLEVNTYPTITFESKGLAEIGRVDTAAISASLLLAGRLTLHGATREITLPVEASYKDGVLSATGETALLISDYKIEDPSILILSVEDKVTIRFRIAAKLVEPASSSPPGEASPAPAESEPGSEGTSDPDRDRAGD